MTIEIDLDAIKRAAMAATPGLWIAAGPSFGKASGVLDEVIIDRQGDEDDGCTICRSPVGIDTDASADMEYIAAANPAVVLELVRRLEEAERDAARYRWLRDKTGGQREPNGRQYFDIRPPMVRGANILQGSVAQHLDDAIDGALNDVLPRANMPPWESRNDRHR